MATTETKKHNQSRIKVASMSLNHGHIEGMGEDADPISIVSPSKNWGAIAVFDGMGGAGALKHTLANGDVHSEAYLASRYVRDFVANYIETNKTFDINQNELAKEIQCGLTEYRDSLGIKPSILKSSITRTLPTTMSMATWNIESNHLHVRSYSAGDSRCYLLDEFGMKQITVDQVRDGGDAMVNLHDDPPMSNTISQSKPFYIERRDFNIDHPAILISCTDGCFGYLQSPMHFEKMILDTMFESDTFEEWLNNIQDFLLPISGDDFSISIAIIGHSFDFWKGFLQYRYDNVKYYTQLYENENATAEQKKQVWEEYKHEYEKFAPTENVEQD